MLARLQNNATVMLLANYTFLWLKLINYLWGGRKEGISAATFRDMRFMQTYHIQHAWWWRLALCGESVKMMSVAGIKLLCMILSFLPRLCGRGRCAADSGWSEASPAAAVPAPRSCAAEAFLACGKERQSPLGALSACARFSPTFVRLSAAPPRPFLPVPWLRGPPSDTLRKPRIQRDVWRLAEQTNY